MNLRIDTTRKYKTSTPNRLIKQYVELYNLSHSLPLIKQQLARRLRREPTMVELINEELRINDKMHVLGQLIHQDPVLSALYFRQVRI